MYVTLKDIVSGLLAINLLYILLNIFNIFPMMIPNDKMKVFASVYSCDANRDIAYIIDMMFSDKTLKHRREY